MAQFSAAWQRPAHANFNAISHLTNGLRASAPTGAVYIGDSKCSTPSIKDCLLILILYTLALISCTPPHTLCVLETWIDLRRYEFQFLNTTFKTFLHDFLFHVTTRRFFYIDSAASCCQGTLCIMWGDACSRTQKCVSGVMLAQSQISDDCRTVPTSLGS